MGIALQHRVQHGRVLAATAVEQGDGVAGIEPQHLHMAHYRVRQGQCLADAKVGVNVKPGHHVLKVAVDIGILLCLLQLQQMGL